MSELSEIRAYRNAFNNIGLGLRGFLNIAAEYV